MEFLDRLLSCNDCGKEFVFTAGEQLFFFDKQFKNDPKRCKPCKGKRLITAPRPGATPGTSLAASAVARTETRTECSACKVETTVPFKPTQGRPVLCRQCFQRRQVPVAAAMARNRGLPPATAQMNSATSELLAAASGEHHASGASEMASLPSRL